MKKSTIYLTVIVAALGYFVDMYDLLLYNIVRISSLRDIGVPELDLEQIGLLLLNIQMAGMLIGGLVWGILGDKKGRLSVLFGSIIIYSIANLANGFIVNVWQYGIVRFLAGFGLAGELGAAITLVSEILPTDKRGYGTTIVASVGIFGTVVASLVGDFLPWRYTFIIGGSLGLVLLLLRLKMFESGIFNSIKNENIKKGDFLSLLKNKKRLYKYINCILIGLPLWFVVGILVTLSKEFATELNIQGAITVGKVIMFTYSGIVVGDIFSGLLSQYLKSRKKTLYVFITFTTIMIFTYLFLSNGISSTMYYLVCFLTGIGVGYWAVFVTIASEQFGTNIRSTVTTTVPNFIRGSVIPIAQSYLFFKAFYGRIWGAAIVGAITLILSYISLYLLEETFSKNLDYIEEI